MTRPIAEWPVEWCVPKGVQFIVTSRSCCDSDSPYGHGNLALHVGDEESAVLRNRSQLAQQTQRVQWHWLNQVHSNRVMALDSEFSQTSQSVPDADGAYTTKPGRVCVVMTADCLPVLMCSRDGNEVAALHAGWRGLCNGILRNGVKKFRCSPDDILVYLGPAIGPCHFEVGENVKEAFSHCLGHLGVRQEEQVSILDRCFACTIKPGKFMANLYQMATEVLIQEGVQNITSAAPSCTFCESQRLYSFRRESVTGRFASAIWLSAHRS